MAGLLTDRLGEQALVVTIGGQVAPLDRLGRLSIRHGRAGADDQPDPASCQLVLYGDAVPVLPNIGTPVTVELGPTGLAALGAPPAAAPRFTGTTTDVQAAPGAAGVYGSGILTVTAVARHAQLGRVIVGDTPWPAERDGARAERILGLAAPPAGVTVGTTDPGTVDVLGRDVDAQPALALLAELADHAGGLLTARRDGVVEYRDAEHRRGGVPLVTLTAADVLATARWSQQLAGLVNALTIGYGPLTTTQAEVTLTDAASIAAHGPLAASLSTQLTDQAAAQTRAVDVLGRRSRPRWRLDALAVDMLRTLDPDQAAALAQLEVGALLAVTGFPSSGPFTAARLHVEGWAEEFTADSWALDLDVTEYGLTGPPPRWVDVPAATTWADTDPGVSWLGALSWYTGEPYAGRWADHPAGDQWNELPTTLTWATA